MDIKDLTGVPSEVAENYIIKQKGKPLPGENNSVVDYYSLVPKDNPEGNNLLTHIVYTCRKCSQKMTYTGKLSRILQRSFDVNDEDKSPNSDYQGILFNKFRICTECFEDSLAQQDPTKTLLTVENTYDEDSYCNSYEGSSYYPVFKDNGSLDYVVQKDFNANERALRKGWGRENDQYIINEREYRLALFSHPEYLGDEGTAAKNTDGDVDKKEILHTVQQTVRIPESRLNRQIFEAISDKFYDFGDYLHDIDFSGFSSFMLSVSRAYEKAYDVFPENNPFELRVAPSLSQLKLQQHLDMYGETVNYKKDEN